jgi:hypothetical protein
MEPFQPFLDDFDNVLHDVSRKPALVMANFKLVRQVENKKNEIRRLRKSLKHKDQQILALRKYIIDMKKKNPTPNDETANILVDFGKYKDLITNIGLKKSITIIKN